MCSAIFIQNNIIQYCTMPYSRWCESIGNREAMDIYWILMKKEHIETVHFISCTAVQIELAITVIGPKMFTMPILGISKTEEQKLWATYFPICLIFANSQNLVRCPVIRSFRLWEFWHYEWNIPSFCQKQNKAGP